MITIDIAVKTEHKMTEDERKAANKLLADFRDAKKRVNQKRAARLEAFMRPITG